ncbi:glycosyltransferase [Rhodobacteraceae bacterium W635]|uniref:glycosyltransferase n=1 Tax=Nioella halotolerans TaxID=2303578 RepID=UPI000E3CEF34|nr:glycosyltransferase [Rhodobacteraceae bacterium W635]
MVSDSAETLPLQKGGAPILRQPDLFNRFFDAVWYLETYRDVEGYADGPARHYLELGYTERRSPHPLFDLNWYFNRHPEVAEAGVEPLSHYFSRGWRKLHSPHPVFDPAWYLLQNTDLIEADIDPLRHYLETGWSEKRSLHPLFDINWYLETYPDVVELDQDPLSHFLTFGWKEGRRPHPLFDTEWYLERNKDIQGTDINPWVHYIRTGWREGRSPHKKFDAQWYIHEYLDPLSPACEPLTHYLRDGWREGLRPSHDAAENRQASRGAAPLYLTVVEELNTARRRAEFDLSATDGRRGTLLLVVHETEVGGAPQVLRLFAIWLKERTRFDVRIVSLHGGNLRQKFAEVAPLLVLGEHPEDRRADVLREWMGDDVVGVFLNSIASGDFLTYAPKGLPTVAFIHELPRVLDLFPTQLSLIREHAHRVIGGGPQVTHALKTDYGFLSENLLSGHSFIEPLPPDVDPEQSRVDARRSLGIPENRFVVMGCGIIHWRKSPDKFIETAELVLSNGIDAEFVWLGGGEDQATCEATVVEKGLECRVRFTGYEPDVARKLAAGDIFLLSSQEDPFPLVALYAAQAGLPIVCFKDAGGIEGFVNHGSGISVPYMDVPAMADAVTLYATDKERQKRDGQTGIGQIESRYTIDSVGPLLLHSLREVMDMPPEVSVVVPNYNYEAYLPERLNSIAKQTFQDFEVILLDDASPDGSVEVLEQFADQRPGTRLVVNTENSGSPFVQWMRGMEMARSGLIWLAEADDRCKPEFLETLLPFFDDRNVRIATCASRPITANGTEIGDYRPLYLDRITPGRWNRDYVATDHEEANAGLGIANSIPNASAVMLRKFDPDPDFVREVTNMRLCGDWYFYVRAMRGGLVGFSAALLNDHRRHDTTVTHKLEGSLRYFQELATVRQYLGRTYRQSAQTKARIAEFLDQDIARFNVSDPEQLPTIPEPAKALPSLLVVAPDLSPGGGQVFAISVANEWTRRGGRVVLLNVGNQPSHSAMLAKISPEVTRLEASEPGTDLATLIERFDIDAIHSGIWWADRWVDANRHALPDDMPWVITMHGCHETILAESNIDPSFPERLPRMIARANWAYIAEKNLAVFQPYGRPAQLNKIPNGVEDKTPELQLRRADVGIRPESVVLCLASRAIPEKGWFEAARLARRLNAEGHAVDLLLLGEGPAEAALRHEGAEHVHLTGQVANPQAYFELADIGLLPSYFVGESLPLVLLEMMAKGLPLVASEIGEIPWIVGRDEDAAGLLIPLEDDGVDEDALHAAVSRLLDADYRATMATAARHRYEADFTIERMVDRYAAFYQKY